MQILKAKGARDFVTVVQFTPDGSRLIAGSADKVVRLWDLATAATVYEIDRKPAGEHRAVTLSPDGRTLVTGDGASVRLWDAATGAPNRTLSVNGGSPDAVMFTPDGRELVTARDPYSPGQLRWDAATGAELPPWIMPSPIFIGRVTFSPVGRRLGGHAGAGVTVWDVTTREQIFDAPDAPTLGTAAVAWSPDSRLLASGSGTALPVWDVGDRREVARLKQPKKHFQAASFSPDGRMLLTVSNEATARVWNTTTWREVEAFAWGVGGLKCVAFAPDGLRAAAGGEKGQIVVWDV